MRAFFRPLASFLLFSLLVSTAAEAKIVDKVIVTVNDDIILESDIEKFISKAKSKNFQELFGGLDAATLSDRKRVIDLLIEEKIIDQQVKRLELSASPAEIDGQIKSISKRNGITEAQLMDRLKQLGTTVEDYKTGLRRQIERRNLVEREIKPSLEVSEEQLRHFYERNSKKDQGDLSYKLAHIFIRAGKDAKIRADKVYEELKASPEKYDVLAKEASDDSSTSSSGGVLGSFPLSQLSKEFRAVVPKLPMGQASAPVKTKAGYHILKVLDAKTADFAGLSKEQKDMLKQQMAATEVEKKMLLWLERKKGEAHIVFASELGKK